MESARLRRAAVVASALLVAAALGVIATAGLDRPPPRVVVGGIVLLGLLPGTLSSGRRRARRWPQLLIPTVLVLAVEWQAHRLRHDRFRPLRPLADTRVDTLLTEYPTLHREFRAVPRLREQISGAHVVLHDLKDFSPFLLRYLCEAASVTVAEEWPALDVDLRRQVLWGRRTKTYADELKALGLDRFPDDLTARDVEQLLTFPHEVIPRGGPRGDLVIVTRPPKWKTPPTGERHVHILKAQGRYFVVPETVLDAIGWAP